MAAAGVAARAEQHDVERGHGPVRELAGLDEAGEMLEQRALELGPAGILVNVVLPGVTLTERMAAALPPTIRDQREQTSPIRRLLAPEEVIPTIVFLCSAANTALTGEIVRASGGRA